MNDSPAYTPRRPRMDPDAYRRILAEVSHIGRPDPVEIKEATAKLRDVLLQPLDVEEELAEATPAQEQLVDTARPASGWDDLAKLEVKGNVLDRNLVITANRTDPAYASFDVLRTRLVQVLREKGWKRVAITSPTAGCGKSFTAINLAMTLSRYDNCRTILMDMDLRRPALARYLAQKNAGSLGDVLRGEVPMTSHLKQVTAPGLSIGDNLAIALNRQVEPYAAELFQQPTTREVLDQMEQDLNPDVVLFDLPPALAQDDVISFRPFFDCVLLVVGGGISTPKEIKEVNRRIGDDKPVLGVVLNMAEDKDDHTYTY